MSRALRVLAAAAVLVTCTGGPAAASDALGLSRDGQTWSPDLIEPLFSPDIRWVPGDVRTAGFLVRNQSDDDGTLSVDILGRTTDTLLDSGDLTVTARGASGAWTDVSTPGTHRLLANGSVPSGQWRQVQLSVALDPASTNASQHLSLDLDVAVHLVSARLSAGADAGSLPDTGGVALWLGLAGVVGVTGGWVVLSRRRTAADHG